MRLLVCGGRDYKNGSRVKKILEKHWDRFTVIIHGGAKGADRLADIWARIAGVPCEVYPADWEKYGKAAGARRNAQMIEEGRPHLVIAFPGGRGTDNMVKQAVAAGIKVQMVVGL